jgi:hypothetical protein
MGQLRQKGEMGAIIVEDEGVHGYVVRLHCGHHSGHLQSRGV